MKAFLYELYLSPDRHTNGIFLIGTAIVIGLFFMAMLKKTYDIQMEVFEEGEKLRGKIAKIDTHWVMSIQLFPRYNHYIEFEYNEKLHTEKLAGFFTDSIGMVGRPIDITYSPSSHIVVGNDIDYFKILVKRVLTYAIVLFLVVVSIYYVFFVASV